MVFGMNALTTQVAREVCNNVPISGKSKLVKQTIDYEAVKADFNVRVTSRNEVDYSTDKGWYMELYKGSGYFTAEKVISQPIHTESKNNFFNHITRTGGVFFWRNQLANAGGCINRKKS